MARKKERIRRKAVVGHDADGKAVVKWVGGYTVKEVEAIRKKKGDRKYGIWILVFGSAGTYHCAGVDHKKRIYLIAHRYFNR